MKSKTAIKNSSSKEQTASKNSGKKGRYRDEQDSENNICFVVSPIGSEGTEKYKIFKDVLDCIIKPAFQNGGYEINIIRADEISKPGSLIKDVLESLVSSYIVIADLTGQNPNVFYELGIRHALSNRTILIAQNIDDVPSDLREYRTIIYDTSARGAQRFKDRIKEFVKQIKESPQSADNPVQIHLGTIFAQKEDDYKSQIQDLKRTLENALKGVNRPTLIKSNLNERVDRILALKNATKKEKQLGEDPSFVATEKINDKDEKITYHIPPGHGNFNLYYCLKGTSILEFLYLSVVKNKIDLRQQFADMRVISERASKGQPFNARFILCCDENLNKDKTKIKKAFQTMLTFLPKDQRQKFELMIWDENGLLEEEKTLGLVSIF